MTFGERLKNELKYLGMTVKELSYKSGVPKTSIDGYLSKREKMPAADTAVEIATVIGVTVEYLVNGEEIDIEKISTRARQRLLNDFEEFLKYKYPKQGSKKIKQKTNNEFKSYDKKVDIIKNMVYKS